MMQHPNNCSKLKTKSGDAVSLIGFGTMGSVDVYSDSLSETECKQLYTDVLKTGCNLFDTAMVYGDGKSETLLAQVIQNQRERVFIATKGGLYRQNKAFVVDGRATAIIEHCQASLQRLNTTYIDAYYLHRLDDKVPLEESLNALADLKKRGLVRYIGLSEVSGTTIEQAVAILKGMFCQLDFIQNEYSLMSREPEVDGTFAACAKHGIHFVAYSPIGRGLFSKKVLADFTALGTTDIRRAVLPRYNDENIAINLALRVPLEKMAETKKCTVAQLALAWVIAQATKKGVAIRPIPGTTSTTHLQENLDASAIFLSREERKAISQLYPKDSFRGDRWPKDLIKSATTQPITPPPTATPCLLFKATPNEIESNRSQIITLRSSLDKPQLQC